MKLWSLIDYDHTWLQSPVQGRNPQWRFNYTSLLSGTVNMQIEQVNIYRLRLYL